MRLSAGFGDLVQTYSLIYMKIKADSTNEFILGPTYEVTFTLKTVWSALTAR